MYLTKDTPKPQHIAFPVFLLDLDMSLTAKLIYALLLDRTSLSKKNGWFDDEGKVYISFPLSDMAKVAHKGITAVKDALHELDNAGLIERKRNYSSPNTIYVKLPTDSRKSGQVIAGNPANSEPEIRPSDSRKSGQVMAGNPANNNIRKNQTDMNQTKRTKRDASSRQRYGSYRNVLLSDAEYRKLKSEIPNLDNLIEQLSTYMESKGKRYKNHAATLRNWAARDRNRQRIPQRSGIPDYNFKDGESL